MGGQDFQFFFSSFLVKVEPPVKKTIQKGSTSRTTCLAWQRVEQAGQKRADLSARRFQELVTRFLTFIDPVECPTCYHG